MSIQDELNAAAGIGATDYSGPAPTEDQIADSLRRALGPASAPSSAAWTYGFPGSAQPGETSPYGYVGNPGDNGYADQEEDTSGQWQGYDPNADFKSSLALTSKQRRAQRSARVATRNNERVIRSLDYEEEYQQALEDEDEGGWWKPISSALNVIPQVETGFISELLRTGSAWEAFKQGAAEYAAVFPGIEKDGFLTSTALGKTARMENKGFADLLIEEKVLPPGITALIAGLVLDIAADPTSWTGKGLVSGAFKLAKMGEVAKGIGSVGKAVTAVTPFGLAGRAARYGAGTEAFKSVATSPGVMKWRERLFEKDLALKQTTEGKAFLNLRTQAEGEHDFRARQVQDSLSGFMSKATPFEKKLVGLYLEHPDGLSIVDNEIDQLAKMGRIPDTRVPYLKQSAREIQAQYRVLFDDLVNRDMIDKSQMIEGYAAHYEPIGREAKAELSALLERLGIAENVPLKEQGLGGGAGPAAFTMDRQYTDTFKRLNVGLPTELDASRALAKRSYAHARAVSTHNLKLAMAKPLAEGGMGAKEIALDQFPLLENGNRMSVGEFESFLAKKRRLPDGTISEPQGVVKLYKGSEVTSVLLVPKDVSDSINRGNNFFNDPTAVNEFLHFYDKYQSVWKAHAILTPGYQARNMISNKINMHLAGNMTIGDLATKTIDAVKISSGSTHQGAFIQKALRGITGIVPESKATAGAMPQARLNEMVSLLKQKGLTDEEAEHTTDLIDRMFSHHAMNESGWLKEVKPQELWDGMMQGIKSDDPEILDHLQSALQGEGSNMPLFQAKEVLEKKSIPALWETKPVGIQPMYSMSRTPKADMSAQDIEAEFGKFDSLKGDIEETGEQFLSSDSNWNQLQHSINSGPRTNRWLKAPPKLVALTNDPGVVAKDIQQLTPEQLAGAREGMQDGYNTRQAYTDGQMTPLQTALYLTWGSMSKQLSPYPHEGGFIDGMMRGVLPWIEKAVKGEHDQQAWADFIGLEYKKMKGKEGMAWSAKKDAPNLLGQGAGAQAILNLRGIGSGLLTVGSQRIAKGEGLDIYKGLTRFEAYHKVMEDGAMTGAQKRRMYHKVFPVSTGIDNKVVSFMLLVTGHDDVVILDRVQARNFWEGRARQAEYGTPEIYANDSDFAAQFNGLHGAMLYEAMENSIRGSVAKGYELAGRGGEGSVGRYHWETWVNQSAQDVDHGTTSAIKRLGTPGYETPEKAFGDVYAKEGKYRAWQSQMEFGYQDGVPVYIYNNPGDGKKYLLRRVKSQADKDWVIDDFAGGISNPQNKIVPKYPMGADGKRPKYSVEGKFTNEQKEAGDVNPWWTDEDIDIDALTRYVKQRSLGELDPKTYRPASSQVDAEGTLLGGHTGGVGVNPATEGLPSLAQMGGANFNAATTFLRDNRAVINLFRTADPSSLPHELAHVFRRKLGTTDRDLIGQAYGVTPGAEWTRQQEELFARNFERYLAQPTSALPQGKDAEFFGRMKSMMGRTYQNIEGSAIGDQIPDEVRGVMDKMLGAGYKSADSVLLDGVQMYSNVVWNAEWRKLGLTIPDAKIGKHLTIADVRDLAQRFRATGNTMADVEFMRDADRTTFDYFNKANRTYRKSNREAIAGLSDEEKASLDLYTLAQLDVTSRSRSLTENAKHVAMAALETAGDNMLTNANRAAGSAIENVDHMALFVHGLHNGKNPMEAAEEVKRVLFDYNNLTDFERTVMKRGIPFYAWMRFNIPLQIHALINDPGRYAMFPKLMNNIESMSPEWEDLPTPDYFDELNTVRLPYMRGGKPMYLSPNLPYNDLNRLGSSFEEAKRDIGSAMGPMPKLVMSLLTNRDPYKNTPIENYPGEMSADVPLTKTNEYILATQFPSLQRFLSAGRAAKKDELAPWLLSTMLGIKLIPSDIARNTRGDTYAKLALSKAIRDKAESQRRRYMEAEKE